MTQLITDNLKSRDASASKKRKKRKDCRLLVYRTRTKKREENIVACWYIGRALFGFHRHCLWWKLALRVKRQQRHLCLVRTTWLSSSLSSNVTANILRKSFFLSKRESALNWKMNSLSPRKLHFDKETFRLSNQKMRKLLISILGIYCTSQQFHNILKLFLQQVMEELIGQVSLAKERGPTCQDTPDPVLSVCNYT